MKRFLLGLTLILSGILVASEPQGTIPTVRIIQIENHSLDVVKVDQIMVKKLKKVALLKQLEIPFVSWLKNYKYREADIKEQPYIPKEALVVFVGAEEWGLWRDERGILYALRYKQGKNSQSDCVSHLQKVTAAKLLLTITQDSALVIKEAAASTPLHSA